MQYATIHSRINVSRKIPNPYLTLYKMDKIKNADQYKLRQNIHFRREKCASVWCDLYEYVAQQFTYVIVYFQYMVQDKHLFYRSRPSCKWTLWYQNNTCTDVIITVSTSAYLRLLTRKATIFVTAIENRYVYEFCVYDNKDILTWLDFDLIVNCV